MSEFQILKEDRACYEYAEKNPGDYDLPEEYENYEHVPKGKLIEREYKKSIVYPGTARKYWIYVPDQYTGKEPAALMVFLDGDQEYIRNANVPNMLDNMIFREELPVMIGLFIAPGDKGPGYPIYGGEDNRSVEYDSTNGVFAGFLEKDIFKEVKKEFFISEDPELHGICGMSSGGQAAFSAAWNRPDLFRKVISHCGSFTAIRGGQEIPFMVRKEEKKPIRVFLQTGEHDLNIVFGDWKKANETLASALKYKGYDYRFVVGTGSHSVRHGASLLPKTMRWLWNGTDNKEQWFEEVR